MMRKIGYSCCVLILVCGATTRADVPAAKADDSLRYEVIDLEGKVRYGDAATCDPLKPEGWRIAKKGDLLGAGLIVHVPFRAKLKLVARPADPPTVMLFESGSLLTISDLHLKNGVATSRIKLGYGAIRAGVAEGGTRSDMEIEAPVATLSKKGTDIFRFEYHNGRFMMSLSEQGRGMLQAIQNQMGGYSGGQVSRFVTAGQFITQQLMKTIDNVQFDRDININDQFGLIGNDRLFTLINDRGLAFLFPTGNRPGNMLDGTNTNVNNPNTDTSNSLNNQNIPLTPAVSNNPGGNFGIGQGGLPNLFSARQTPLSRNGPNNEVGRQVMQRIFNKK